MSEQMPDDERLSALYQRTPRDEPSAQVDIAIKKLAHEAVRQPWVTLLRMAMAASVLLMVGVGIQVYQEPVPKQEDQATVTPEPAKAMQPPPQLKARQQMQDYHAAPSIPYAADQAQERAMLREGLEKKAKPNCEIPKPLVGQKAVVWQQHIQKLRDAGKQTEADCLQKLAPEK